MVAAMFLVKVLSMVWSSLLLVRAYAVMVWSPSLKRELEMQNFEMIAVVE